MLDTPGRRPEMSDQRAAEIISFIENGTTTEFSNIRTESALKTLAELAYSTADRRPPADYNKLIQRATMRLGKKHDRIGLDLGRDRAKHLVNHLLGKETYAFFRQGDDIIKQRELLRKAIAAVSSEEEFITGDSRHYLVVQGDSLIEEKYPLDKHDTIN